MGYAVVDVETTGLSPVRDRIVEIGVILLGESGEPEGEWQSLINPLRGMGAVSVHGLTDADVVDAPTLVNLLPQIRGLFSGRALVAHNTTFDVRFLNTPFARVGYGMCAPREATVYTTELSKIYPPPGRRGLAATAKCAGVVTTKRHHALADAHTVAGLLRHYLNAEADGVRYAERTFSRSGEAVGPAARIEARGAAAELSWSDFLS